MAYDLKRTSDMNKRSSDLALGGNGLTGDVKLMLLRFEFSISIFNIKISIFKFRFLRSFD